MHIYFGLMGAAPESVFGSMHRIKSLTSGLEARADVRRKPLPCDPGYANVCRIDYATEDHATVEFLTPYWRFVASAAAPAAPTVAGLRNGPVILYQSAAQLSDIARARADLDFNAEQVRRALETRVLSVTHYETLHHEPPTRVHYSTPAPLRQPTSTQAWAIFAFGCFWGVQDLLSRTPGVIHTRAGYTGGYAPYPNYEQVCAGRTGHVEAVYVIFDPATLSFSDLLSQAFAHHDPTHDPTQFDPKEPDLGSQYAAAVFCSTQRQFDDATAFRAELQISGAYRTSAAYVARHGAADTAVRPIVTRIEFAETRFWPAEPHHDRYFERHPDARGTCAVACPAEPPPGPPGTAQRSRGQA